MYLLKDLDLWIAAHAFDHTAAERMSHHNPRPSRVEPRERGAH